MSDFREQLGKSWAIARSTNARMAGDRRVLMVAVGLPVLIMLLVGVIFGSGGRREPVAVINVDKSGLSVQLVDQLRRQDTVIVHTYKHLDHLRDDLRRGRVLAGMIVPAGYGAAVESGRPGDVQVIEQPGRSEAVGARLAVTRAVDDEAAVIGAARFAVAHGAGPFAVALARARRLAATQPRFNTAFRTISAFSYTAPSNLVLFVFIGAFTFASGLVRSRQLGVERRMFATPTPAWAVALGHGLTAFFAALAQCVGLLVIGLLFFGVHWGDPLSLALLLLALCLAAAGANVVMGTTARTPEQAISLGIPLGIALGMLGGCMWSLDLVSPTVRAAGHVFPHAWAMDAFVHLVFDGQGFSGVEGPLLALSIWAVGLVALATWRLRKLASRAGT